MSLRIHLQTEVQVQVAARGRVQCRARADHDFNFKLKTVLFKVFAASQTRFAASQHGNYVTNFSSVLVKRPTSGVEGEIELRHVGGAGRIRLESGRTSAPLCAMVTMVDAPGMMRGTKEWDMEGTPNDQANAVLCRSVVVIASAIKASGCSESSPLGSLSRTEIPCRNFRFEQMKNPLCA